MGGERRLTPQVCFDSDRTQPINVVGGVRERSVDSIVGELVLGNGEMGMLVLGREVGGG